MKNREMIQAFMRGEPEALEWAREQLKDWEEPPKRYHSFDAGFQGFVWVGEGLTPYPSIRHGIVAWQMKQGRKNTEDQRILEFQNRKAV